MIIEKKYDNHTIRFILGDSNEWLLDSPEYDLAIDDPNYGIGASKPAKKPNNPKQKKGNRIRVKPSNYKHKDWDDKPPDPSYFNLLISKTRNQIIWGVNYYNYVFGPGRIVWDKLTAATSDQFDCEIAYVSLNNRMDTVYYMWNGMMQGKSISKDPKIALIQQGNKKLNEKRIHPTQKPVKLYRWLL